MNKQSVKIRIRTGVTNTAALFNIVWTIIIYNNILLCQLFYSILCFSSYFFFVLIASYCSVLFFHLFNFILCLIFFDNTFNSIFQNFIYILLYFIFLVLNFIMSMLKNSYLTGKFKNITLPTLISKFNVFEAKLALGTCAWLSNIFNFPKKQLYTI